MRHCLVVGLTGGIGSGKTTVAELFAERGIPVIDADFLARSVVEVGKPALEKIGAYFGAEILQADGSLNRQKMRQLIFEDGEKRRWLEQTLHPLIRQAIQNELGKIKAPYCIVVIPLLIETGPYDFIDRILVVDAQQELRLERLKIRDGAPGENLLKIMNSQVSREERVKAADDVICNEDSLEALREQVEELHRLYLTLAEKY